MGGTPLNTPDPQKLLQALLTMRQQQGQVQPGGGMSGIPSQGGIPGAAPQGQAPPPMQPRPQVPSMNQTQQGGVPGAVTPARQLSPASARPYTPLPQSRGPAGVILGLVNTAEKRAHDKKVNEAEMYYNQINSFLASTNPDGTPNKADQAKAYQMLDDTKIRKILKTGLEYQPLQEDVPPEALGVHQAQQNISKKDQAKQMLQRLLTGGRQQGNAQPRPQATPGRAIIPGPSQQAQQASQLEQAKIAEQQALAKQHGQEGNRADVMASAEKQKADAETLKAQVEQQKADAEKIKNQALADEAKSHAKLYDKLSKEAEDTNPMKQNELQAHANEMNAMSRYHDAMAKYVKNGKLPGSKVQDLMKGQRADIASEIKGYQAQNMEAMKEIAKNPWYRSDSRLQKLQDDAGKKAKDLASALAWYDGGGMQAVLDGKMTPPEAYAKAHKMAGINAPPPTADPNAPSTSTDDEIMKLIGQ